MAEQTAFLDAYSRTSGGHAPLGREHGTGGLDNGGRLLKGQGGSPGVSLASLSPLSINAPGWYVTSQ